MGIGDAADAVKKRSPDTHPVTDAVKKRLPDPHPVADAVKKLLLDPQPMVDAVKRRLPDPQPVADAVKKLLPDPQTVKDAYSAVAGKLTGGAQPIAGVLRSSYDRGRYAISTVDKAVRIEGLNRITEESMPDKEALKRIGWTLTDVALDSCSRTITGGLPVYRTLKNELAKKDAATQNLKVEELKELCDRVERLEAKLADNGLEPPAYPHHRIRPRM